MLEAVRKKAADVISERIVQANVGSVLVRGREKICKERENIEMDSQKVTQVLTQIFKTYGISIVQRQSSFKAAVLDLLPEREYKEERIVLRNAIEADAFLPLVTAGIITADTMAVAAERMRKTAHMTDEAAGFVIQCVVAALDGKTGTEIQGKDWHSEEKEPRKPEESQRSRPKSMVVLVLLGILVWGGSFLVFYLADEIDVRYMPVCSLIISICAVCWLGKCMDSNIFAAAVLSIVWGAVGFLIFFLAFAGVHTSYYNDDYYDSYHKYKEEQVPVETYDDINKMLEDIDKVESDVWEHNNGSFYYNGRQYGLSYRKEQILMWAVAAIVIILIHFVQKVVLKAASRLRNRKM